MLPPVGLPVGLVEIPILVIFSEGVSAYTIGVKARILWYRVCQVEILYLAVKPAYLFKIVVKIIRGSPIIWEP